MDRRTTFAGQLPLVEDGLQAQQFAHIAVGEIARACLGSAGAVDGFVLSATAPASLALTLGGGQVYQLGVVEETQWSALPADSRALLRQGILLDPTTLTFAAPSTPSWAQNYLIQVAFDEIDTGAITRPYFNAANPTVNFEGPGGDGAEDDTVRKNTVSVGIKAGVAAAVGTQVTPAPDPGFIGLYVVTVPQGTTQLTSANWSQYTPSSFIPVRLPEIPAKVQTAAWVYAQGTGTANALQASISPAPAALVAGMKVSVRSSFTSTGNVTFNLNGLGNKPVLARDGTQLNAADIVNGQIVDLSYNGAAWQLQSDRSSVTSVFVPTDSSLVHVGTAAGGTTAAMTTTLSPVPSTAAVGLRMEVPVPANNAAGATLDFGFGAKPLVMNETGAAVPANVLPGTGSTGYFLDAIYDGTSVRVMTPSLAVALTPLLPIGLATHGVPQTFLDQIICQITGVTATDKNTFSTSTFSGGVFTVGAGEGGLYGITFAAQTNPARRPHALVLFMTKNDGLTGTTVVGTGNLTGIIVDSPGAVSGSNDVPGNIATTIVNLQPGDYVKFWADYSTISVSQGAAYGSLTTDDKTTITIARLAK